MRVYTRTGDKGTTTLFNGKSVNKDDNRIKFLGSMDELNCHIGLIKNRIHSRETREQLENIQENLMSIMANVAGSKDNLIWKEEVKKVEGWIDEYQSSYPAQNQFVLPGKTELSALIDIVRTVARRVEIKLVQIHRQYQQEHSILEYANRLSDYFYVLARSLEFHDYVKEQVTKLLIQQNKVDKKPTELNLTYAKRIMEHIEEKAADMGLPVVIAIVDAHGNPKAVHVMEGALLASYDIAVNKAFTSVAVKISTKELGELAKPGGSLYGIQDTNQGRIVIFGGGIPLKVKGQLIGGLGISGGTAEQDEILAQYGAAIIEEVVK